MFRLLILIGAFPAAFGQSNLFNLPTVPGGVRARFDTTGAITEDFYIDVPVTIELAVKKSYTVKDRPARVVKGLEVLDLYCPKENSLCVLYDDTGYIAGLQYALNQDRYTDAAFDWETQGFTEWTVDGQTYWTIAQYFVTPEFLATCPEERIANRTTSTLQLDGIWATATNNTLLHIPGTVAGLEAAGFVKQACVQGQGLHYAYKPSEASCSSLQWLPWVPIVYNGTLTGCIFTNIGKLPPKEGERYWFENISAPIVHLTLPDLKDCVIDLIASNGVVSMHTFYFANPWTVTCCPAP